MGKLNLNESASNVVCEDLRTQLISYTLLNKQIEAGRVVRDLNGCLVLKREMIE